eukprot:4962700-Amphidinium_carterae.2
MLAWSLLAYGAWPPPWGRGAGAPSPFSFTAVSIAHELAPAPPTLRYSLRPVSGNCVRPPDLTGAVRGFCAISLVCLGLVPVGFTLVGPVLPPVGSSPYLPLTRGVWHEAGAVASTGGLARSPQPCVPPRKASWTSIWGGLSGRLFRLKLGKGICDDGGGRSNQASQSSAFLEEEGSAGSTGTARPTSSLWSLSAAGQPGWRVPALGLKFQSTFCTSACQWYGRTAVRSSVVA